MTFIISTLSFSDIGRFLTAFSASLKSFQLIGEERKALGLKSSV